MTPVEVDADVVSYIIKGDSRAVLFVPRMLDRKLVMSFMTEAELELWVLLANWGPRRVERLRLFLAQFTIVPSSRELVRIWAELSAAARRRGRPIQAADAWVAATALLHDAPLLTNNRGDYSGVPGLRFLD